MQLSDLEKDGIIQKNIYQADSLRTDYQLTEFGKTLAPVISSMAAWEKLYNKKVSANKGIDHFL